MSRVLSAPQDPREKRAAFPLAFAIIIGIMIAIACILMPLANRPDPPRQRSMAQPIPRAPTVAPTSRPVAPASPPAVLPLAVGLVPAEVRRG